MMKLHANIINDCFLDPQQSYVPLDESDKIQYAGPASDCMLLCFVFSLLGLPYNINDYKE
jgi:hypothetical protein